MKLKISLAANAGQKRRMRERREDQIEGDHLSQAPAKVTRAAKSMKHRRKSKLAKSVPYSENENTQGDITVREIISTSHDVIFNPTTQTTRYSVSREAKRNLERRMPGYAVDVLYGSGEGILQFYANADIVRSTDVGHEMTISVSAKCVASPTDMAVHSVELICDGRIFEIVPIDKAMFPEEAVQMLSKIAENVANSL